MQVKKNPAKATLAGALGAAAVGLGAGIAQADPLFPVPPPVPGDPGISVEGPDVSAPGLDLQGPDASVDIPNVDVDAPEFQGPGANIGGPGSPVPPGLGDIPPGHGGPMPNADVPEWAPPQPPPPPWAPFAPVQWSMEAQGWGVYTAAGFQAV